MAERRPLHQQFPFRSGLETGGQAFDPPLLPYEKALIETIGCSVEEYKTLVRHAMLRQRVRPAEYDHIPDIVNDPVTAIVVNVVVGFLFTAASVLLAPKPPSFESGEQKKITGKKLADQVGPSRYNQSTSFDNSPSLAELNSPIPIPFGSRGVGADRRATGGLIFVPALVWSRVYAYGTYQAYEGIYVAGEYDVNEPDLGGILLGTSALSALGQRDFSFFWSSNKGSNRFTLLGNTQTSKHQYGTQGTVESGTNGRKVFCCPSEGNPFSDGFSMSYVPSGDTSFGVSTPIHNGTPYKYNWQVISAPYSTFQNNSTVQAELQAKRRKIAGTEADDLQNAPEAGMPGIGRAYSRHMGFIYAEIDGVGEEFSLPTIKRLNPGDRAVFEIHHNDTRYLDKEQENFAGTEVNLQDLVNSAKAWRQRASDLLTTGSRWISGGVVFVVQGRQSTPELTHVTLLVVANQGDTRLGFPGTKTVREALGGYEGGEFGPKHVGAGYWNLCRYNTATIRPVRRDVDTIELGIRSQVWNRASGLCNFNAIPTPSRLHSLDKEDVNVETGRMDKYFTRSSCFALFVRPVADVGKTQKGFARVLQIFCVQGNSPVDQFNYLRIRPLDAGANNSKILYEYRLSPLPGTIALKHYLQEEVIILQSSEGIPYHPERLETAQGGEIYTVCSVEDDSYGEFGITTQGRRYKEDGVTPLRVEDLRLNRELQSNPPEIRVAAADIERWNPLTVTPGEIIGNNFSGHVTSSLAGVENATPRLAGHAWLTEVLGMAKASENQGKEVSKTLEKYKPAVNGTIRIKVTATSSNSAYGAQYLAANGQSAYEWVNPKFEVVSATGSWPVNTKTEIALDTPASTNVFAARSAALGQPYDTVHMRFAVQAAEKVTASSGTITETPSADNREFEQASGLADVSFYSEITKSCDSGPEHEVVYVNECLANENLALYDGMSTVGFVVKSSGEINGIEQLRLCCSTGIRVERLGYIYRNVSALGLKYPSNIFADLVYYLLTNSTQGVGNIVPVELVDKDSLKTTADFLTANKIYYDGVIEDSESLRNFLYETAPLQLCTFTIKNGKFGMIPALPYKSIIPSDDDRVQALEINDDGPIAVDEIFTAGNIIEDSFQLEYIDLSQRSNIRAVVTWRVTRENDLPYQASALLYWNDLDDADTVEQSFDLSDFCTNREQALRTARFLMSTRRRVTKTVSFKTAPDALHVQPGSYIRVMTEASVYDATNNGVITEAGTVVSTLLIEAGKYKALLYGHESQEVIEADINISIGDTGDRVIDDTRFYGHLFSLLTSTTDYSVYQIDSLNLEEDGLVSISAVEVPTDENGHSIVAQDVLDRSGSIFRVLE